jgi:hypothetical protein
MRQVAKFILLGLILLPTIAHSAVRSELDRFTLLYDRALVDQHLQGERFNNYFAFNLGLSSQLKEFIGDVKDASVNETDSAQQIIKTTEVLTQNLNTENYLDLNLAFGIPLPALKISGFQIIPNLFGEVRLGASLSINNQESASNPQVQTYLKKQIRYGVHTKLQKRKDEIILVNVYQERQADTLLAMSQTDIIGNEGTIVGYDGLTKDHVTLGIDLRYQREFHHYRYAFGIDEIHVFTFSSDSTPSFGKMPLLHAFYQWKDIGEDRLAIAPFIGSHYRTRYSFVDGLYTGFDFSLRKRFPFKFRFKLNDQFISLTPYFQNVFFTLKYNMDIAYKNPQDDFWVASIHSLNIIFNM